MSKELIPGPDFLAGLHETVGSLIYLMELCPKSNRPLPPGLHSLFPTDPKLYPTDPHLWPPIWPSMFVVMLSTIVRSLLPSRAVAVSGWPEKLSLSNSLKHLQSLAGEVEVPSDKPLRWDDMRRAKWLDRTRSHLDRWRETRDTLATCLKWVESTGLAAPEHEASDSSTPTHRDANLLNRLKSVLREIMGADAAVSPAAKPKQSKGNSGKGRKPKTRKKGSDPKADKTVADAYVAGGYRTEAAARPWAWRKLTCIGRGTATASGKLQKSEPGRNLVNSGLLNSFQPD